MNIEEVMVAVDALPDELREGEPYRVYPEWRPNFEDGSPDRGLCTVADLKALVSELRAAREASVRAETCLEVIRDGTDWDVVELATRTLAAIKEKQNAE